MDKQTVVYAYNTTQQKRKQTTDLHNMDEYQKLYTEQSKQDTKCTYCMIPSIGNSRKDKTNL